MKAARARWAQPILIRPYHPFRRHFVKIKAIHPLRTAPQFAAHVPLFPSSRRVLHYIEPDLKNVARWESVLLYHSAKHTFVVTRNVNENVGLFFGSVSREARPFEDILTHAFQIEVRVNAVHKSRAKNVGGYVQTEAGTRTRRRKRKRFRITVASAVGV